MIWAPKNLICECKGTVEHGKQSVLALIEQEWLGADLKAIAEKIERIEDFLTLIRAIPPPKIHYAGTIILCTYRIPDVAKMYLDNEDIADILREAYKNITVPARDRRELSTNYATRNDVPEVYRNV
jgi:hypothetical protein